jgi:hypothetical protein
MVLLALFHARGRTDVTLALMRVQADLLKAEGNTLGLPFVIYRAGRTKATG